MVIMEVIKPAKLLGRKKSLKKFENGRLGSDWATNTWDLPKIAKLPLFSRVLCDVFGEFSIQCRDSETESREHQRAEGSGASVVWQRLE
jgi:hypothetical protein